ncbi:MAG: cytochrome c oxidase assembly protein [Candidatus Marinimicrobia bacterium]|nr:cytochrome c oxidase assembly protein [Candidatus Neomarinimicrobiota bacterium]|tara:strand:- start:911 stop:1426 length:516 start_codon:yes stop_codon:yes gene_type:complete
MTNNKTAILLSLIVLSMIVLVGFSVPLYDLFCRVTGYGGKTNTSEIMSSTILERDIDLKFSADVNDSINWSFEPPENLQFKVGENLLVNYKATNLSSQKSSGTATFNVLPEKVGAYFIKTQCFCFEKQTLNPGETVNMPVIFYVDPAINEDPSMEDVEEITLSYTFFKYIE